MTLALYGKSRRRQQGLLFFGLMAIITAALAGASWTGQTKSADAADTAFLPATSTEDWARTDDGWDNRINAAFTGDGNYSTDDGGDRDGWDGFAFIGGNAVPAGSTINGIRVRVQALHSDADCNIGVSLSSNGGSDLTAEKLLNPSTAEQTVTVGATNDLWGRDWAADDFGGNFVVALRDIDTGDSCMDSAIASVDLIEVSVSYTGPVDTDGDGDPKPSVSLTKTHSPSGPFRPGDTYEWRLTATVLGANTTGVHRLWDNTFLLSPLLTESPADYSYPDSAGLVCSDDDSNDQTILCDLPANTVPGTYTVSVTMEIPPHAPCTSYMNTANILGPNVTDGVQIDTGVFWLLMGEASDEITITGCGDLSIDKSDSTELVDGGTAIQWVIGLHNSSAINQLAKVYDAGATLVTSSCVGGNTATQLGDVISCNVPPGAAGGANEATITVKTASTPSKIEICDGATRTNTAHLLGANNTSNLPDGGPQDTGTATIPAQADDGCISVTKNLISEGVWHIVFTNTGPAANVNFSDTYEPTPDQGDNINSIQVLNVDLTGCVFNIANTVATGCDVALGAEGTTTVVVTTDAIAGTCEGVTVRNTVNAFFGTGNPQGALISGSPAADTYFEQNTALCPRDIRVVKVTTATTHAGGTFGGAITPGGADQSWSQSLAANGQSSPGEDNAVGLDAQTITETTLPAGWVNAGFHIAPDTEQACPTDLASYTTTNTVPEGSTDYLVCVRNAFVTIDKVSADVNGSSEPYAPGEEFHWDITVTIAGGVLQGELTIIDSWDDAVVDLDSVEPGAPFTDCGEGPVGTVTCALQEGTGPGTHSMSLHMIVRAAAGCGTTTNNVAILEGQRELDTASDDIPLDCRRTIQLCKAWRLDAPGELADAAAANFSFNVSDTEEAPPGELVNIGGVQEDGDIECILMDVRFGLVTISEVPNAGFVLDGWNFLQGDAPDGSFPTDANDDPATLTVTPTNCFASSQSGLAAVLNLVSSIQAVVIPATGTTPLCTITFVNHDLQDRLPTGDLRIEKWNDINGDGNEDPGIGEGLITWDVTIAGPDAAVAGPKNLPGGQRVFSGLETGDVYNVTEDSEPGWTVTNTTVDGVSIGASTVAGTSIPNGGTTVIRFYNQQRGSISVHKEAQTSHNGNVSAAPNDDDGWTFTLVSVDCGINHVGQTDANGNFTFSGLPMCDDYVVTEQTPNALSPGFVPVGPSSFSNQTPIGQTLTFLNRRTTSDPPCQNCTPTTPTTTPVTPTATPTTPTTPTATPTTPPASPTTPVTQIAGETTPGPATPVAPSTGSSVLSASGAGLNIFLLLLGLVALSSGLGVLALGRRTRR